MQGRILSLYQRGIFHVFPLCNAHEKYSASREETVEFALRLDDSDPSTQRAHHECEWRMEDGGWRQAVACGHKSKRELDRIRPSHGLL